MSDDQQLREAGEKELEKLQKAAEEEEKGITTEKAPPSDREDKTVEEAEELFDHEAEKSRIAQILDKGQLNEKLRTIAEGVPDGRVGKFVRDRPEDIMRYENLGYRVETYAEGVEDYHDKGDNRKVVGDVVLMSIQRDRLELLREVRTEKTQRKLGAAKTEYKSTAEARRPDVPVIDESRTTIHRGKGE